MEGKYFQRKISEGSVKRTHVCSFDSSIKLQIVVVGSKSVIDYLLKSQTGKDDESAIDKAKEQLRKQLSSLRINGLPIVLEDLESSFDSEEIMEVIAFLNDADMSVFGGEDSSEKK